MHPTLFSLRQGRQLMSLEPASSIHTLSPDYRNVVLIFHDYVDDWNILERRLPTYLAARGCRKTASF